MDSRFTGFELVGEEKSKETLSKRRLWRNKNGSTLISTVGLDEKEDIVEVHYRGTILQNYKLHDEVAKLLTHPVEILTLNDCGLQDREAFILADMIKKHRHLTEVRLSIDGITAMGRQELRSGLNQALRLRKIDIYFSDTDIKSLHKVEPPRSSLQTRFAMFKSEAKASSARDLSKTDPLPFIAMPLVDGISETTEVPKQAHQRAVSDVSGLNPQFVKIETLGKLDVDIKQDEVVLPPTPPSIGKLQPTIRVQEEENDELEVDEVDADELIQDDDNWTVLPEASEIPVDANSAPTSDLQITLCRMR